MWGPDAEEASPELKETYDCVNEIYEQEINYGFSNSRFFLNI